MKISREGVLLIKSFEGFRSRATANADGGWVIGYGHQASAREGASVSEAEAELLLQYDLIPIQAALTQGLTRPLNQHQYDALASFAFSVGVDAFLTSDVLSRVNSGEDANAVEALTVWPESPRRDAGLRRRAAERALFLADPAHPVALADLLAAPLPPPQPAPEIPVETVAVDSQARDEDGPDAGEAQVVAPESLVTADPTESEPAAEPAPAEVSIEAADDVEGFEAPAPIDDGAVEIATSETGLGSVEASEDSSTQDGAAAPTAALLDAVNEVVQDPVVAEPPALAPIVEPAPVTPVFSARYMAYAGTTFGPLPTANDDAPAPVADVQAEAAVDDAPESVEPAVAEIETVETAPIEAGAIDLAPVEIQAIETVTDEVAVSEPGLTLKAENEAAPVLVAAFPPPTADPSFETAPLVETPAPIDVVDSAPVEQDPPMPAAWEAATEWSAPTFQPSLVLPENPGADPFAGATLTSPTSSAPLVWPALNDTLTESADGASSATPRLVWPREDATPAASPNLFEDSNDLNLAGAATAWDEGFDARPNVFAWRKVWAYLVMGGFGLVSLAVSMAALRKASLANTDIGGILAIAAVLALIGAACVGVSAYNIYQRITDDR